MKKFVVLLLLLNVNLFADEINILFLGDTHFGDNYQENPKYNRGIDVIKKYGYDYFFENVKNILDSSSFAFANLETPLIFNPHVSVTEDNGYVHWADADSTAYYLNKYNIRAVNIANNHVFDFGPEGYSGTIEALGKYNIPAFGAGNDEKDASKPFVKKFTLNGKEFELAVIGAYWFRSNFESERNYYAKKNHQGVNMLNAENISEEIRKLKIVNPNTFVVVYPHWGGNYTEANEYQEEIAHKLIDAGVDLIIGQGAHKMQKAEQYKGKWVIYNLGNFIFNAPGRYASFGVKPYSLIAKLVVNDSLNKELRLYPIYTDNMETNYRVRLLNTDEFNECYELLNGKNIKKQNGYFGIKLNQ